MTCAYLIGSYLPERQFFKAWIQRMRLDSASLREKSYIVAVDGGWEHLTRAGVQPDMVIGDGDSSRRSFEKLPHIKLPREKNESDLACALKWALSQKASAIEAVGVAEGRPDHHIATLQELSKMPIPVRLSSPQAEYYFLHASKSSPTTRITLTLKAGQLFSVFTLGDRAQGITIQGARYSLKDYDLLPGSLGLSNQARSKIVKFSLKQGRVVVIVPSGLMG